MQKISALVMVLALALSTLAATTASADQWVNGYTRKDGTYVQPYHRSSPDSTTTNNYSYPGNVNPYTGKQATGNPNIYNQNNGTGTRSKSPYGW